MTDNGDWTPQKAQQIVQQSGLCGVLTNNNTRVCILAGDHAHVSAADMRALAGRLVEVFTQTGSPGMAYDFVWNTKEWLLTCADDAENNQ